MNTQTRTRKEVSESRLMSGFINAIEKAGNRLPEPALILADEPTGSLDSAAGSELCGLLRELCREKAHTVVMVTHEPSVALAAKHVLVLKDGAFAGEIADTAGLAVDALSAEYHRILEIAE